MARIKELPRSEAIGFVDARSFLGDDGPPPVDPKTGCPTKLRSFVVNQEPRISVVPQFLSQEECEHLMSLAEGQWYRSLVGTLKREEGDVKAPIGERPRPAKAKTRTSQSAMLRYAQSGVLERIEHRLASLAGLPVEQLERVVMVRYSPGEMFDEHHDGKFRPRTIFVYLNDLPDDDGGGDTFFPHLGLSFRPRGGTAVVWSNATPEGQEDSRMVHAGRPPRIGVKYGVNCFFNNDRMRIVRQPTMEVSPAEAAKVDLSELAAKHSKSGESVVRTFVLNQCPDLKAVQGFATGDEVDDLLRMVGAPGEAGAPLDEGDGPFSCSTRIVKVLESAETPLIASLEQRLAAIVGFSVEHLARLRVVQSCSAAGLCNRGCGQKSATICLAEADEVLFPHLGFSVAVRRGDLLFWPNAWEQEKSGEPEFPRTLIIEDMHTRRLHLNRGLFVDASFQMEPIRAEQREEAIRAKEREELLARKAAQEARADSEAAKLGAAETEGKAAADRHS